MVEVGAKEATVRVAIARAVVRLQPSTMALLREGRTKKGEVLATARIAGIQAAKRTPELIPLCHGIALTGCEVRIEALDEERLEVRAETRANDRTGVEMEAMTAASVAALTLYDMLKAHERGIVIERVELIEKRGGKSGRWVREPEE
jgi:cyclic pyranopterin phosphate synthase